MLLSWVLIFMTSILIDSHSAPGYWLNFRVEEIAAWVLVSTLKVGEVSERILTSINYIMFSFLSLRLGKIFT